MVRVVFTKNEKEIGAEEFLNLNDAENKFESSKFYDKADYYKIIDVENDIIIDENEIVNADDIIDDMFGDEENKEGFDWTLGE